MRITGNQYFRYEALLLLTAVIWGFAFVAQRAGMEFIGPFTFNGIRFALGCVILIPFIFYRNYSRHNNRNGAFIINPLNNWRSGIIAGVVLFCGASLQQVGIVHTTAGKAGFITGLYVIIVPVIGIFRHQRAGLSIWFGALIALVGMYLLSINGNFRLAPGDFLVFLSAFFWALHVQIIHHYSAKADVFKLAAIQFGVCSVASSAVAIVTESVAFSSIILAGIPILYGGLLSVGIAYTLQVIAQQKAHPSHAAIILSLETVFAAIGGWLILGEVFSRRGLAGCGLMLAGMLIAQLSRPQKPAEG